MVATLTRGKSLVTDSERNTIVHRQTTTHEGQTGFGDLDNDNDAPAKNVATLQYKYRKLALQNLFFSWKEVVWMYSHNPMRAGGNNWKREIH